MTEEVTLLFSLFESCHCTLQNILKKYNNPLLFPVGLLNTFSSVPYWTTELFNEIFDDTFDTIDCLMAILILFSNIYEGLYETCIEKIAVLDTSVPFLRDRFLDTYGIFIGIEQIIYDIETST